MPPGPSVLPPSEAQCTSQLCHTDCFNSVSTVAAAAEHCPSKPGGPVRKIGPRLAFATRYSCRPEARLRLVRKHSPILCIILASRSSSIITKPAREDVLQATAMATAALCRALSIRRRLPGPVFATMRPEDGQVQVELLQLPSTWYRWSIRRSCHLGSPRSAALSAQWC